MSLSLDVVVLGIITGLTYAILALGLSLIYKSARFVNFAHGNLGALCAILFAKGVIDWGIPYWIAFILAVAFAGALGGLIELTVVRRLFDSPRLVLVVATIAISQLLLFVSLQRSVQANQIDLVANGFPVPFDVQFRIGSLLLRGADVAILLVIPLLALGLGGFFRFTAYGQAVRAAAENPDAARLAGISVRRVSTLVWVIAGILAAVTAILLAPKRSTFQVGALGPSILVRALGASLVGRMTNLPIAFGAGIGIGVIEAVAFANFTEGGVTDLVVFLVVMAALAFRGQGLSRSARDAEGGTTFGAEVRNLPRAIAERVDVKRLRAGGTAAALLVAVVLPNVPVFGLNTSEKTFLLTLMWGYAIVGLSLTLLTGWAGQVSLGQFALVGVGSFAAARFAGDLPLPILLLACGLVGAVVAVLVGLPAVRIQGLFLAVSTLAFAVVANAWAFQQELFVGSSSGVSIRRPPFIRTERATYYLGLGLVVFFAIVLRNLRRSGPGRALLAVRDNEKAAQSNGLWVAGTRLLAFALSGFMVAVAGVLFAYARGNFTASEYPPAASLDVLLMVIIGGLGSVPGAILGAVFVHGLPAVFGASPLVQLATSSIGVLVVLLFLPGGLIALLHQVRDALIARLSGQRRAPMAPPLRQLVAVARGKEVSST